MGMNVGHKLIEAMREALILCPETEKTAPNGHTPVIGLPP
jgi:hypothetical protein